MKVVVSMGDVVQVDGLSEEQISRIRSVSEDLEIVVASTDEALDQHLPTAEIILGRFNRSMYEKAKNLKLVMVEGAGIDALLFDEFVNLSLIHI